jgi:hypothetical protein
MAYVPKHVYDVFLSYASENNQPPACWVDDFKAQLENALRSELAVCYGERRLVVWQDKERLKPGFLLTESIRAALSRTAAFVSLYSPSYLASGYCAAERKFFTEACGRPVESGTASRLVNVVIRTSGEVDALLRPNDLHARLCGPHGPLPQGSTEFQAEFQRLVDSLTATLKLLRNQAPKVYVSLPDNAAPDDTLSKHTIKLLEDLSTAGYARTSEVHPAHWGDTQLEDEIRTARLSVHLVADPTDALTRRQIEAALRAGVPVEVWLSESARTSASDWVRNRVPGPGREYSEDTFTAFCRRVQEILTRSAEPAVPAAPVTNARKVFVLFNPQQDKEAAAAIRRRLVSRSLNVTFELPSWDDVHGVLVYHKGADDTWFESKLETVTNVPVIRAACIVPPPDKDHARALAQDYRFTPPSDMLSPEQDAGLLLEGDDHEHLQPFVNAVLGR